MKSIDEIASKHLGKAGDGSVVKPYITPDEIDSDILVAVPRHFNRTDYGIMEDSLPFVGFDVWNAYEVSALTSNGFPVTGIAKIVYSCNSPSIVESKSLKLYLNSFNMHRFNDTIEGTRNEITHRIVKDLSKLLDTEVYVSFFMNTDVCQVGDIIGFDTIVEDVIDPTSIKFDTFNEDPNTLQYTNNTRDAYRVQCGLLRSNCRITNQPDWGTLFVEIRGNVVPTYESLVQYVVSMRKENHFHEEILECVYKRLRDALPEADIAVGALYTRRGGIDINPIRASSHKLLKNFALYIDHRNISFKTINQ